MQLAGSRGFVEAISFCVKFVYVEVFSLLPKKDVSSKHLLHNLDSHVTDTVSRGIEVVTSGFLHFLPVYIASVFSKPVLERSVCLTNVLFTTVVTRDTVDNIWSVASDCCVHFYSGVGCMGLDHLPWD